MFVVRGVLHSNVHLLLACWLVGLLGSSSPYLICVDIQKDHFDVRLEVVVLVSYCCSPFDAFCSIS